MPVTTGPLSYHSVAPALSGDRLFVIGEQRRAELQRLDVKTGQFLPFLNGISAGELDFSHDGQWVAYVSYRITPCGGVESMAATNFSSPIRQRLGGFRAGLATGSESR
jgi:hypothetical protein